MKVSIYEKESIYGGIYLQGIYLREATMRKNLQY
jgi:hypothetical protein